MHTIGARKFAFLSSGPLGCVPALRAANPSSRGGCFEEASALAKAHNVAFSASLQKLGTELHGFKYCTSNFYSWFNEKVNHPNRYGMMYILFSSFHIIIYTYIQLTNLSKIRENPVHGHSFVGLGKEAIFLLCLSKKFKFRIKIADSDIFGSIWSIFV